MIFVGRKDSIKRVQVLESCPDGLVATITFKQPMVTHDGTKVWTMTALAALLSAVLTDGFN